MRRSPAIGLSIALVLAVFPAALQTGERVDRARYLSSFRWAIDAPWFGGFSGLSVSADGRRIVLLGDRAILLTVDVTRQDGIISGLRSGRPRHLRSSTGARLAGRLADSEGLAIGADGTVFVSYEGIHRVARHDTPTGPARVLDRPAAFRAMPRNGSLEALAIDATGRLFTLPERARDAAGNIPVFRYGPDGWTVPFALPARGRFRPVGADFGPDGRFYLLERAVNPLGFRARLRRWDVTETAALNETTLLETATGTHDNLEGVSVWRDAAGRLRATMIADDNFNFFQHTELVEYALPD